MKAYGTVLLPLILAVGAGQVAAQSAQGAAAARPKRMKVAVMDFDYGTISNQWWGDQDIGKGVADQIVDGLVNDGSVIVVERKKLDTVLAEQDFAHSDRANPQAAALAKLGKVYGVKYIVAGSITRFGTEEKNYSAGAAKYALGPVGMFGFKKAKTQVGLTARVIDATTGEILLSAKAEGLSKKGGGLNAGGLGKMAGGASISMGTEDYKMSAIGEAQDKACQELVTLLLAKVTTLE
jgi:curli biogenesis system outer membrane secretion channel CsgG